MKCLVTSVPETLRGEAITDLVGDITITCTGGPLYADEGTMPAVPNPAASQVNITITLNSQVTSRLLPVSGAGGASNASEALLLIDEPNSGLGVLVPGFGTGEPFTPCATPGTGCGAFIDTQMGTDGNPYQTAVQTPTGNPGAPAPNVFQGIVAGNQVTFLGVPVIPPGPNGARVFRITNVRINASGLGGGSASGPLLVLASIQTSNPFSLPLSASTITVGFVESGLTFSAGRAVALQCTPLTNTQQSASLVFSENFATAFKPKTLSADPSVAAPQNVPGANYDTESGLIVPAVAGSGLADYGTRLKAVFHNVPSTVSIWVSTTNIGGIAGVAPFAQLTASETGSYAPVASSTTLAGTPVAQVSVVNGTATVVWEVASSSPSATETVSFGVFFASTAGLSIGLPNTTINGSFAATALPPPAAQPATAAIPRFVDNSTATTIIAIQPCQTTLLFPFVTNQGGFDTGLAIASSSLDPFGTSPQSGTCTFNSYGMNAQPPITSPAVNAGTTYSVLASTALPNFSGYVMAVCNFQYVHGFAFISDVGARNLAMGYLPLVVIGRPGQGTPMSESLVN